MKNQGDEDDYDVGGEEEEEEVVSIHGHEVMQMMIDSDVSYTKETLYDAIVKKFGENARFHTCSRENMTPREIIDFLESRGKFMSTDGGFKTDESKICNH